MPVAEETEERPLACGGFERQPANPLLEWPPQVGQFLADLVVAREPEAVIAPQKEAEVNALAADPAKVKPSAEIKKEP